MVRLSVTDTSKMLDKTTRLIVEADIRLGMLEGDNEEQATLMRDAANHLKIAVDDLDTIALQQLKLKL